MRKEKQTGNWYGMGERERAGERERERDGGF